MKANESHDPKIDKIADELKRKQQEISKLQHKIKQLKEDLHVALDLNHIQDLENMLFDKNS